MSTIAFAAADDSAPPRGKVMPFARLVADLVARFVNIEPAALDATIIEAERQIVLALDVDRASFFQVDASGDLRFTHHWTRPEFAHLALPERLSALSAQAHFPWFFEQLRRGEMVVVDDVEALPSEIDRVHLQQFGTKSNIAVPLLSDGELMGALSVASIRVKRAATHETLDAVRVLGQTFAQALQHRRDQEALRTAMQEVTHLRDLLARDNELLHREVMQLQSGSGVTAESVAAREAMQLAHQVASTNATVLLLGETGAGKEVFAKEIH